MKLKSKNSIKVAGKLIRSGQVFEIENVESAKRLIAIGAAEQIMVPAADSIIEETAKAEEKPAGPQGRPAMTRRV